MKVLLIQPNREFYEGSFDVYGCMERSTLPLGLLYLASAIMKNHEVRILDCLMDNNTKIYRKGRTLYHGLEWERIRKQIEDFDPDVIGMTIPFTAQESAADKILAKISRHFPKIKIVLGGCAISVNYEKYLKKENVFAIIGEGEKSLPNLLEHFQNPGIRISDIPNLAYRKGGKILKNPINLIEKLDSLGLPSYDLIEMEKYLNRRQFLFRRLSLPEKARMWQFFLRNGGLKRQDSKRDVTMFTSRGCPFNCIFCSIHSQFGYLWRAHSAEYISSHIKFLAKQYGINYIHFEDDNLTLDQKRFYEILDRMEKSGLKIRWDTPNGVRADRLDYPLLRKMKKNGCMKLLVAIESGNERVRNHVIRKNLDMDKVEKTLAACKELGIQTGAFYIIGFPDETREEMQETLRTAMGFKMRYGTVPSMFIAQPLPETDLLKECKENKCLVYDSMDSVTYSRAPSSIGLIKGKHLGPEEIVKTREDFVYRNSGFPGKAAFTIKKILNIIA